MSQSFEAIPHMPSPDQSAIAANYSMGLKSTAAAARSMRTGEIALFKSYVQAASCNPATQGLYFDGVTYTGLGGSLTCFLERGFQRSFFSEQDDCFDRLILSERAAHLALISTGVILKTGSTHNGRYVTTDIAYDLAVDETAEAFHTNANNYPTGLGIVEEIFLKSIVSLIGV